MESGARVNSVHTSIIRSGLAFVPGLVGLDRCWPRILIASLDWLLLALFALASLPDKACSTIALHVPVFDF